MKLISNFGLFIFTFLTCISLFNTKSVTARTPYPLAYCNVHGNQNWTSYLILETGYGSQARWIIEKNEGSSVSSNPSERTKIAKEGWKEFNQLCIGAPIKKYKK